MREGRAMIAEVGNFTINGLFEQAALTLSRQQYLDCAIYKAYADAIGRPPTTVKTIEEIPFLPISFFKTHKVTSGTGWQAETVFESSGTTAGADVRSRHYVRDVALYRQTALQGFEEFYGSPKDYVFLALLPGYTARQMSSLVAMVQMLMEESGNAAGGFYLDDEEALLAALNAAKEGGKKVMLIGVTFALLDLARAYRLDLSTDVIVMETGGMKGRKAEWTRADVHRFLVGKWNLARVHSEYGMTELLSQAYSAGEGVFQPINSLRVLVREVDDPLSIHRHGTGVLNVIDLGNEHSCAFIATEDLGRVGEDGRFEVLGRMDHSALRGCSLMTA